MNSRVVIKLSAIFFLKQNKVRSSNTRLRIQKPILNHVLRSGCNLQHHLMVMKSTFIEIHDFSTIFFIIFFFLVFGGLNVWDFFQISKSIVQSHSVVVSHHDYCVVSHDLIWSHWPSSWRHACV